MHSANCSDERTTRRLSIRLLGQLDVRYQDVPMPPFESGRAESLLAYLLLHRDSPQPRSRLAFLLWPDSTESQARTNLRHVLHTLRRALPDPERFLAVTPRTLQWRPDAPFWLDVKAFEDALARADADAEANALAALREATDLYGGDLLEGSYDEWLQSERDRLLQRHLQALERLTSLLVAAGDHGEALRYAERLVREDPLREQVYRQLMRLYDARGERARALRTYHLCAATLERELGVQPSAPTREVYEALLPLDEGGPMPGPAAARDVVRGPGLVGRRTQLARLTGAWRETRHRGPMFVLVTGEPGIGKTRLVEEFRTWCAHQAWVVAEARSYAVEGALAFGPVIAWIRSPALRPRLERLDRGRLSELARLLPELLSEMPGLVRPEPLPEEEQRRRLFDALAAVFLAEGRPLLLVADDLHWSDPQTLQFLHYLLRVDPQARLLVTATARPEELDDGHPLHDLTAGLHALERCVEIDVSRLTEEETALLAERLTGRPLDAPSELYAETEGNPLFVVEALRAGWAQGAKHALVTAKVQGVISSRLAQLSEPARHLVDVAAAVGRAFTSDVLALASGAGEDRLVRGLDELWRRRIVREHGADGYDFSHDRIREVAYLALSPPRRRSLHLDVARALEQRHEDDLAAVSGQLAAHYERAGQVEQAVLWYRRAADDALRLHAGAEAIRLMERGLELVRALPRTPERDAGELAILSALPGPLGTVEGYASSRIAEVQQRALELARELGAEPAPPVLRSLAIVGLAGGDFARAREFGARLKARGGGTPTLSWSWRADTCSGSPRSGWPSSKRPKSTSREPSAGIAPSTAMPITWSTDRIPRSSA
jgi:DNA-binding SARP family transcriptional activator